MSAALPLGEPVAQFLPPAGTARAPLQRAAHAQALAIGWPKRRDEAFGHLMLRDLLALAGGQPAAAAAAAAPSDLAVAAPLVQGSSQLVLLGGRWQPQLGDWSALQAAGATVEPLAAVLKDPHHPAFACLQGEAERSSRGLWPAINAAHLRDGLCLRLPAKLKLAKPIEVVYVRDAAVDGAPMRHPRLVLQLGAGAEATLVERFGNPGALAQAPQTTALREALNVVTQLEQAAGSHLQHLVLQEHPEGIAHLAHTAASLAADSSLRSFLWCRGASLARHQLAVTLCGRNAAVHLAGLYLGRGKQQQAVDLQIVHAEPHGRSEQLFKGIVDDAATAIFAGTVHVLPTAPATSAQQVNKNLLLSPRAAAYTRPRLEIGNDDVQCTHGATVGQLENTALFYLRSRGLDDAAAARLLSYAFACDVTRHLTDADLRAAVESRLQAALAIDDMAPPPAQPGARR